MIDLDALEASIADGERRNLFVAPIVKELIAEVRELRSKVANFEQSSEQRSEQRERAAVVAWLREQAESTNFRPRGCPLADAIERGEHRREEAR